MRVRVVGLVLVLALGAACSAQSADQPAGSGTTSPVPEVATDDPGPIADAVTVECSPEGGTTVGRVRARRDGVHLEGRGPPAQFLVVVSGETDGTGDNLAIWQHRIDGDESQQIRKIPPGARYDLRCRMGVPPSGVTHLVGSFEVVDPDSVWIPTPKLECSTFTPDFSQQVQPTTVSVVVAQVTSDLQAHFGPDVTVTVTGYPEAPSAHTMAAWLRGHAVATMSISETRGHALLVSGQACTE